MKLYRLLFTVLLASRPLSGPAVEPTPPRDINPIAPSLSLDTEAHAALERGLDWLAAQQKEDGSWSNTEFPALAGLALWALSGEKEKYREVIEKGVQYILSCVHDDGSIYREPSEERKGGGLSNYNTAICMVALHLVDANKYGEIITKARAFIAGTQHFGNDVYHGGMGYDPETQRAYADLSNSYLAFEAMRMTEQSKDLSGAKNAGADLDWDAASAFIERVQNRPESNDQPWASDDPDEYGGFAYKPDSSQAGSYTNHEGVVRLRSYGSMTYAGLLSFIYADVKKDDPRVTSALEWASNHWTLEENPGVGSEGLFYYYNVLSKALATYGEDTLTLADGSLVNWRSELLRKLLSIQRVEASTGKGYWKNDEGRWWEADPVLVTSYTLIALQAALGS